MKIKAVTCLLVLLLLSFKSWIYAQLDKNNYTAAQFWQTTLSAHLHLDKRQFKLCEGIQTVGDNSYWLWSVFNSVTAMDNEYWYNPSQFNRFSDSYGLLLYQAKTKPNPDSCNLNTAILKYYNAQHSYAWNKSLENLFTELNTSEPMKISADTSFIEQHVSDTLYQSIKINANVDHILVFISYPLSQTDSLNLQLQLYKPWFTLCFLKQAFENVDDAILSPENWDCAFDSAGYLTGICKALIIVDRGSIIITATTNRIETSSITQITSPIILGILICNVKDYLRSITFK